MNRQMQQVAKQMQRLILSPQMQQALNLLQLPIIELASLVTEEMTQNPLLEWEEEPSPLVEEFALSMRLPHAPREEEDCKSLIENTLAYQASLYEVLLAQAHEAFADPAMRQHAEWIIGSLNEDGFLTTPLEEIALMAGVSVETLSPLIATLQTFEPSGVAAHSLQESFLIQLRKQGKEGSLAYQIVKIGFERMLKNQMNALAKKLQCCPQLLYKTISEEIACLDFHPGRQLSRGHYRELGQEIVPDILIHSVEGCLEIEINKGPLPTLKMSPYYLDILYDPHTSGEVKSYLHERLQSSKWLMRNLQERQHTLYRITERLLVIQKRYFTEAQGALVPLTMKEIADMLEVHESTVTRAVSHKYVSCSRGIFPLRSLFTHAYTSLSGESVSSHSVKTYLREIIAQEEKGSPLSDEMISDRIQNKGVPCARRTVAKYRQELGIGNAAQRKIIK